MSATPTSVDFGAVTTDTTANEMVTLTHTGAATDPAMMVQLATITGTDAGQFSHDITSAPMYVFPGSTVDVDLSFTPTQRQRQNSDIRSYPTTEQLPH